ncbi:tyrosinase-like protein 1 [Elsinoe australis]|uniref:Tyrosinase-like protein 1 n=1 Tax=Elsinoe australis TaxID=40998 RepID=A0A4U7BEM6_9PEZI|nr:tyrosinase-like protein 1 [Elsinoe australis]
MKLLLSTLLLASQALTAPTTSWVPDDTSASQEFADIALQNALNVPSNYSSRCDPRTAPRRREWHDLSLTDRRKWIAAVRCLQTKPSKIGESVPGAKTRYDDFHIQQTPVIHGTGNFLSWHRHYTWAFEQALRTECNYTSHQPYLNWGKISSSPLSSPLFDGSPSSIGNNGAYRPHPGITLGGTLPNRTTLSFPPGLGGGCHTSGPFANTTVNLGPVASYLPYLRPNPLKSGLGYNPQCIIRDINPAAAREASDKNVTDLLTTSPDIAAFQSQLQGVLERGIYGVHTSGHYLLGGAPGGDFFTSPGDPYFWLHHAMVDRVWWMWQGQVADGSREEVVAGTVTMNDEPHSRDATLEDEIDLGGGLLGETVRIRDAVRTTAGPYCYLYE